MNSSFSHHFHFHKLDFRVFPVSSSRNKESVYSTTVISHTLIMYVYAHWLAQFIFWRTSG